MKKTIIDLFETSVEQYGAKTFLLEKRHRKFEPTTYAETKEQALEVWSGARLDGYPPRRQGGYSGRRQQRLDHLRTGTRSTPERSAYRCR